MEKMKRAKRSPAEFISIDWMLKITRRPKG
jgi:hypothetical protein